tara:strand:- start:670 stop:1602 length:933 start_codon:yes stop_codon:yes gene_type:complete
MKKIFVFVTILLISSNIHALAVEYDGLEKLSKKNTFMDDRGKPYSIDEIKDKQNSFVIIYNHGSIQDVRIDPCKAKPSFGYIWDGAVVPAILKLHNIEINGLKAKIYRLCSGVKGMTVKNQKKYRNLLKANEQIEIVDEFKNIKRQNIIFQKIKKFQQLGFENIVLAGYSAGGWASLNLQSRYPNKIKGTIAFNPAFAGHKNEWQKKFPEWGAFRDQQINILNKAGSINAILFAHEKDIFEDIETLSFFKKFEDLKFVDYSMLKPTSCKWANTSSNMDAGKGHNIPQSRCFTKFVKENNYLISFLEKTLK